MPTIKKIIHTVSDCGDASKYQNMMRRELEEKEDGWQVILDSSLNEEDGRLHMIMVRF